MFTFHLWTLFMMMGMVVVKPTWAQTTCAAEANFQGCKAIQETKLSGCPPADYACMCTAHKLIQECYNLCPSYATDASIHDGTVKSICGAVPSSSSSSMAIPTLVAAASSSTHPSSLPSASPSSPIQQGNQQHSRATVIVSPSLILVSFCSLLLYMFTPL